VSDAAVEALRAHQRRRRTRRRVTVVIVCLTLLPVYAVDVGVGLPRAPLFVPIPTIVIVALWLLREGYRDARSRGLPRWRAPLTALKILLGGWWSTSL
jgi:hypothetical protein